MMNTRLSLSSSSSSAAFSASLTVSCFLSPAAAASVDKWRLAAVAAAADTLEEDEEEAVLSMTRLARHSRVEEAILCKLSSSTLRQIVLNDAKAQGD